MQYPAGPAANEARQLRPGRVVALKMILPGRRPNDNETARFRREIETVAGDGEAQRMWFGCVPVSE